MVNNLKLNFMISPFLLTAFLMLGASLISFLWGRSMYIKTVEKLEDDNLSLKRQINQFIKKENENQSLLKKVHANLESIKEEKNSIDIELNNIQDAKIQLKDENESLKKVEFHNNSISHSKVKETDLIKEIILTKEVPVEKIVHEIKEVEVIKEVPVEVIKEVEVIKQVEVIKEVPVQVPVEIIKEVEVIKEVPVEVIVEKEVLKEVIKEVPVEVIKEVEVEVVREVPVEIVKEVEVVKQVDMELLKKAMDSIQTVEISKSLVRETVTKKESDVTERRVVKRNPNQIDDLKRIEGIGPKISEILFNSGIKNYWALAESTPKELKQILLKEGPRYKMHNPGTWPKQARLAAKGKWNKLLTFQDKLKGGEEE